MNSRDLEQEKAINAIREELSKEGKALAVACTGYGKGHLIKKIAEKMNGILLVVVPKVNLVSDIAERIGDCSVYCASLKRKEIGKITVGTIQSLRKIQTKADLIILDEVHNYKDELVKSLDCKYIIGLTATDFDSSGYIHGDKRFWNKPCYEFSIEKAIEAGYLCDYKMISSVHKYDLSSVKKRKREYTEKEVLSIIKNGKAHNQVKEIFELTKDRKKIAILCANIEHAEKIKSLIEETEPCAIIHSKLKDAKRDLQEWKESDVRFSVSVIMLSEGFDYPAIDCVCFLRPTRSARLMIQASGRGLRLYSGKLNCLLIDFGDTFLTCGSPRNPILEFTKSGSTESDGVFIRECSHCNFIWDTKEVFCPSCGKEHIIKRDVEKSLNESIFDDDVYTIVLDKNDFESSEWQGNKNCVYKSDNMTFYFYGGHYWKAVKKKPIQVTYRKKEGKHPKVIKVSVLE